MTPLPDNTTESGPPYNWVDLELPAHVEPNNVAQIRLEPNGVIRLRGAIKIEAGQELKANELLATIPAAYRLGNVKWVTATDNEDVTGRLRIEAGNGQLTFTKDLPAGHELPLDGITWPITP